MQIEVKIEGLEDEVRRIVADVLAEHDGGDPWYTAEGAAAYLGTTVGVVRNLRHADKLFSPSAPGTKLRFRRSELDRYAVEQS